MSSAKKSKGVTPTTMQLRSSKNAEEETKTADKPVAASKGAEPLAKPVVVDGTKDMQLAAAN